MTEANAHEDRCSAASRPLTAVVPSPLIEPAAATVTKPAVEPAIATRAPAAPAAKEPSATATNGSASTSLRPKMTSEEIEKVDFCRRYLAEIAKEKIKAKGTLVHALKIKTTLGGSGRDQQTSAQYA